jgi:uncharacterized protein (DUF1778 family)
MTDDAPSPTTDNTEATILGIRIPEELRTKIKEAAAREERTESSFARYYLGRAADEVLNVRDGKEASA